jgi:hypothetical protein
VPNHFSKTTLSIEKIHLFVSFIIINFQCIPLENNVTSVGLLRLVANLDARRQSRAAPVRAPTSEIYHDDFSVTSVVVIDVT